MSARFYNPGIGAFTQFDSVLGTAQNPISMNRFLYAGANPATLVDPTGHQPCSALADMCAGPTPGSTHINQHARQDTEYRYPRKGNRASSFERRHHNLKPRRVWAPPSVGEYEGMTNEDRSKYVSAHGPEASRWLAAHARTDAIGENPTAFYVADAYEYQSNWGAAVKHGYGVNIGDYVTGEDALEYIGRDDATIQSVFLLAFPAGQYTGMSDGAVGGGGSGYRSPQAGQPEGIGAAPRGPAPQFARSQYGRPTASQRSGAFTKSPLCPYCGTAKSAHVEHINPLKLDWKSGGWMDDFGTRTNRANSASNLIGACAACNLSKGARPLGTNPGEYWPPAWPAGQWWPFGGPD